MATTTTNFGWDIPQSTDLVKDGATAIAALGQDIDTSLVGLKGGTAGQVLSKTNGTDMAFTWVAQDDSNAIQNAIVDAKGDLIAATAADTPARLAVGTNGQVLTADSTASTGIKWASPSSGALTLLSTTSFSAASSVSLPTNTFSSTYDDYLVLLNVTSSSADQYVSARMRASGTDNTTSNYASGFFYVNFPTSGYGNDNGGSSQTSYSKFAYCGTSRPLYVEAMVRSPFASRKTGYATSECGMTTEVHYGGGLFNADTSFDAMTFYVAGNFTGAVSVYGISK